MKKTLPALKNDAAGFTLVELAISLTIIGLLMASVMVGEELFKNAKITRTMAQVKQFTAATMTFREKYGVLPGDMLNPSGRLPNCANLTCNIAGNEDGTIGPPIALYTAWPANTGSEWSSYWQQLAATGLITGIDMDNYGAGWSASTRGWGSAFPASIYGGGFTVMSCLYTQANAGPYPACKGHFFHLLNSSHKGNPYYYYQWNGAKAGTVPVRAIAAMDKKYDDGRPYTGDILMLDELGDTYDPTTPETTKARVGFFNVF